MCPICVQNCSTYSQAMCTKNVYTEPHLHPPSARPGNLSPPQHCHNIYSLIWGIHPSLFSRSQQPAMRKVSAANIISISLLVYYICGVFVFVFYNSSRVSTYDTSQEQTHFSSSTNQWDFSFLDEVSEDSIRKCIRLNSKYGTSFDCTTTPYSGLRVPYGKLPLDEKIEARLADFFKAVAGLLGRSFWAFPGMHIFLAFFALAPLVVLVGAPLLWRLLCRAWGRKQVMAERPIYRGVVGVFALVILVLAAAVVGVAMMDRPEGEKGALSEAAIEAHDEMVRNLLN